MPPFSCTKEEGHRPAFPRTNRIEPPRNAGSCPDHSSRRRSAHDEESHPSSGILRSLRFRSSLAKGCLGPTFRRFGHVSRRIGRGPSPPGRRGLDVVCASPTSSDVKSTCDVFAMAALGRTGTLGSSSQTLFARGVGMARLEASGRGSCARGTTGSTQPVQSTWT